MCDYHPYLQAQARLFALQATGHLTDKINIRVIGGTWSAYPARYQSWFMRNIFKACNDFKGEKSPHQSLIELQETNETTKSRIVEISIETRQDFINQKEIRNLRKFGVTKVELGVQSIYDAVLKANLRGHNNDKTIEATRLLKDAGFKVSYQLMANLLDSNILLDKAMFGEIFNNSNYRPDHIKIYPLALVKESRLYRRYLDNKFTPYDKKQLTDLLMTAKKAVPTYCRIERVVRDIPASEIVAGGAKVSNLRQDAIKLLEEKGGHCLCIRCREIKNKYDKNDKFILFRIDYDASSGKEIFLSFETSDRKKLAGLLRLRIPSNIISGTTHLNKILNNSAIIRELHIYGPQVEVGKKNHLAVQHRGFGKKLLKEAENIALKDFNISKMAIISGVGVREYFKKFGYKLDKTYMTKEL